MPATIARPKDACKSPATAATHPATTGTVRNMLRAAVRLPLAMALIATVALAGLSALAPQTALGGTSLDAKCNGIVLRSKPSPSAGREGRIGNRATVVAVRTVVGSRWHTKCGGRSDKGHPLVQDRQRQRQERAVPLRQAACLRRAEPVLRDHDAARGRLQRRSPPQRHAHPRAEQAQACGGREGHRVGHGIGRQVERRLRPGELGAHLVPDHQDRQPKRVLDLRGSRRCTWPAACCGRGGAARRRRPRPTSTASTSATGRTRSTG